MNRVYLSFVDGPKVEIVGDTPSSYHVQFIDDASGLMVYDSRIQTNNWCAATLKYFVQWRVKVEEDGVDIIEHCLDLRGKKVFVQLGSKSLGDTIAWIPYVEQFRRKHGCEIDVATHWNEAFDYPCLKFISPGSEKLEDYYAAYRINAYDNAPDKNRNNWRLIPLQQIASDYLGLEKTESRAAIKYAKQNRLIPERYVAIAEFSTFLGKQWNYPEGWQKLVAYLNDRGYKVMSVSREPTPLKNVTRENNRPLETTINNLRHAELFIGISSGPSWLAWSLGVPTAIIGSMTDPFVEMESCIRVHNSKVCHGCYGDLSCVIDRGNFRWCPRNRSFECSAKITVDDVIRSIAPLLDSGLDAIALRHGTDKASNGHDYCRIYDPLFEPFRSRQINLLEIGVFKGASIRTWIDFFPKAEVYGLDTEQLSQLTHPRFHYVIGNQRDPACLEAIAQHFDIVIDDGCHCADAVKTSFDTLWPRVNAGGLYIIEDVFAFWDNRFASNIDGFAYLSSFVADVTLKRKPEIESVQFQRGLCIIRKKSSAKVSVVSKMPRFSLVMPTENRPDMALEAVQSILAQDFADWELIVMDAGQVTKALLPNDPRIRHVPCTGHHIKRFNEGLALVRGELVNFCSDDDLMLPGALRHVHETIGDAEWFYGRIRRSDTGNVQGSKWNADLFRSMNLVPTPAAFWTRKALTSVGTWDTALACSDWDYWQRLSAHWTPKDSDAVLVHYRVHPQQDTLQRQEQMEWDVKTVRTRAITNWYRNRKILFIAPHLSTGGMPQYLLKYVKELLDAGSQVQVIEWSFLGNEYVVQRDQIKALCPIHCFRDNKTALLQAIVSQTMPTLVHLQEFPEMFMDDDSMKWLYRKDRSYRICETGHSTRFKPSQKRFLPDNFVFVSQLHKQEFAGFNLPMSVRPHPVSAYERPDRSKALRVLGLNPDQSHVLQVGLFAPWKNQAFTFEVARLLPEMQFHFVGNQAPNFSHYWKPLMESKPDNCSIWGERGDVDAFYAAMDLLLFPSLEECSPLVPKEALAWGMPVLMRRLESCADDFDGKVTFIDDNAESVASLINQRLAELLTRC